MSSDDRLRPAVFLDRDGTINVEVNYLHRIADLALIPGAAAAIRRLNQAGFAVVIVTNQAGIARGFYDEAAMRVLHDHLLRDLGAQGARIDAIYFCPHHPDLTGPCPCRKPAPGMLIQASAEHCLDLGRSWLIGDNAGDIGAAHAVGARAILVRTGYGARTERDIAAGNMQRPEAIVDDIGAAVDLLLDREGATLP